MIKNGEFIEYAEVFGNYYGEIPKGKTEEFLINGKDIIFDVDWQGGKNKKFLFSSFSSFNFYFTLVLKPYRKDYSIEIKMMIKR